MRNIVMVGAGSFALSNAYLFDLIDRLIQFYDDPREENEKKHNIPVSLEILSEPGRLGWISCIGNTRQKRNLIDGLAFFEPLNWINVEARIVEIHRETVKIGRGNMLQPWVSLRPFSMIGDHNLLCGQVNVGHDTKIGSYCTLAPKATLCGSITIEDGAFLGAGCILGPNVKIGEGAILGEGTIIPQGREVPANEVWVGNPGRKLRTEEPW